MKLTLFSFTQRQPSWLNEGVHEYAKRFSRDFPLEMVDLKPENRQFNKSPAQLLQQEAKRFKEWYAKKAPNALLVVLDERGKDWSTKNLSQWLEAQMTQVPHIAFLIGSADGIDPKLKASADLSLRLSSMTLPHGIVKLLLVEQLYRSIALIHHHPYHRDG